MSDTIKLKMGGTGTVIPPEPPVSTQPASTQPVEPTKE